MKHLKNPRIAVIEAQNAVQFENMINDKLDELSTYNPALTIEHGRFYRAYIQYVVETTLPETIAERFELCGFYFKCRDCSQFERARNRDGSIDRRAKYGYCLYKERRAHEDMTACERFHIELLKAGRTPNGDRLPKALILTDGQENEPETASDPE